MAKKSENTPVVVHNAMIDILGDDLVIRGYIKGPSLGLLKIDEYQREERSEGKLLDMVTATIAGSRLPDGELSMRGENYREVGNGRYPKS